MNAVIYYQQCYLIKYVSLAIYYIFKDGVHCYCGGSGLQRAS